MSLTVSKTLSKLPALSVNVASALSKTVVTKRNISRTTPNQFFFGKKPAKFSVEKLPIPNPSFKMGVPQKVPSGNLKTYEPKEIKDMLRFLMGAMPRSSNLISTVSEDGVTNVAPYALCTCVSVNPPIISLTVSKKPDGLKDTGKNIEATKEFGVSIVSDWFIESSMAAGGEFPSNVSEFEKTGLTPKPSSVIKAPLVAQSAVSLECKLISCTPFTNKEGVETCVCYQGEVVKVHANDEIYDNTTGNFNYEKFGLVAKLGGLQYAKINSLTEITLN